jgi:hypothetical protein
MKVYRGFESLLLRKSSSLARWCILRLHKNVVLHGSGPRVSDFVPITHEVQAAFRAALSRAKS